MAAADKIRILLADEDGLRREGLAAVLRETGQFEVIAQCPDGESALGEIRGLLPDVAIVDLNLPRLHGIELVRCVRGESLGTKIIVLSGTGDDDIIREVVRSGGDGYLLKNGPARHLIDAISYVRDGGQYFSPQLRRDGLERRLIEETARPAGGNPNGRYGRSRRPAGRTSDPRRLGERLREDSDTYHLAERDYRILDMMADGIRPILDRLDEIEGRVGDMESGEAPVPGDVRGWLSNQIADTFEDSRRPPSREVALEKSVSNRFHNMASKLQEEIEETHVRTLEAFVKNIQVKLVKRVSALETDLSKQAAAMHELREYSQRTEDNLSRLITGVDKLAQELPKRLAAPASALPVQLGPPRVGALRAKALRRGKSRAFSPVYFWVAIAAIAVIAVAIWELPARPRASLSSPTVSSGNTSPGASANVAAQPATPASGADTKTKLQAAQEYSERKDYAMAEDIYKQVIKAEPGNVDAIKALASVLYREDKIEESAAVLDRLPKN
jgi:DNA-binding NarL/FixJ family response regulator/TolA-binding protein